MEFEPIYELPKELAEKPLVVKGVSRGTVSRGALFSQDDKAEWRYGLWRLWTTATRDGRPKVIAFVGLNPSTADESQDDPTVRRCIRYAQEWGYDGMYMLNAYGYRSTDPKGLWRVSDPVGHGTDQWLKLYSDVCQTVIACWGNNIRGDREAHVRDLLDRELMCLGTTRSGHPRHPLYLPKVIKPSLWWKPCRT